MNIPMTSKKPMRTSELGQINRTGRSKTLQELLAVPASNRGTPRPEPRQSAPPPPKPTQSAPTPPPSRPAPRRTHPPVTGTVLQKGQKISLSQLNSGLDLVEVGLGWELGPGGQGYDLDVEAFLLGPSGKVLGDDWFVFYNQPVSPDGAVRLLETAPTGGGPSDDAVIQVRLSRLNPGVNRIVFILTINDALAHGYHFGNVTRAYARVVSQPARRELVRFQLTDYYSSVCSMMVGELYRYKDEWRFNPVGNGTGDDLEGLCKRYGVNV